MHLFLSISMIIKEDIIHILIISVLGMSIIDLTHKYQLECILFWKL
jgi:hypothetical protein